MTVLASHFFKISAMRCRREPAFHSSDFLAFESRIHRSSVCRNLFGTSDPEENMKFMNNELAKIAESDAKKWNFDFANGKPLEGRYAWEAAPKSVPAPYRLSSLQTNLTKSPTKPSVIRTTEKLPANSSPVQLTSVSDTVKFVTKDSPKQTTNTSKPVKRKAEQPKITEFMKTCKRPRPSSPKAEDDYPVIKKARMSSS